MAKKAHDPSDDEAAKEAKAEELKALEATIASVQHAIKHGTMGATAAITIPGTTARLGPGDFLPLLAALLELWRKWQSPDAAI